MRGTRRHRVRAGRRSRIFGPMFATILMVCVVFFAFERTGFLPEPMAVAVRQIERWLTPILSELGIELPPQTDRTPPITIEPDDRVAVTNALKLLDRIVVEPERNTGYDREAWSHWLDLSGNCMSTRHEVLVAESIVPPVLSTDGCTVLRGLWYDVYTGETFSSPRDLDIDHFVPLAEAHRSGGYAWDHEWRISFANDLQDPRTLIAVSASANRSKGDQGPEEWMPPNATYQCRYVASWVAIKVRWSLRMDERERVSVGNLLQSCAAAPLAN